MRLLSRRSRAPWDDRTPIRAEIFGPARFTQHAISLADSHMVVEREPRLVSIVERLDENAEQLRRAHRAILAELHADRPITPAAEWLIDNYYVIERTVRQIHRDLPGSYFRELPKLGGGFLEGHPRIFGIMWAYVAHTDSLFDPDLLATYVRGYETRKALTIGELWAGAITLRLLLIENARRIADLVVDASADRRRADELADRVLESTSQERVDSLASLPVARAEHLSRAFAVQLVRRLRGRELTPASAWIRRQLRESGADLERVVEDEHHAMASATVTMRNIFTSLRLISDVNWEDWLESVSLVEAALRTDRGYAAQDFPTRNLYRSAVEDLARGAGCDEIDVARGALHRARQGDDEVTRDVGYWLLDDGLRSFARAIGAKRSGHERLVAAGHRLGLAGYLGALTVGVAVVLAALLLIVRQMPGDEPAGIYLLLGALALLPLSDIVLAGVNHWCARFFHAAPLPALALRYGVPAEHRTLVVIPALLTSLEESEELVALLEVHYLANSFGEIHFALVSDWTDSPTEHRDGDAELVERAVAAVRDLNERYPGNRFLLLHRGRRFNQGEGVWMGWERKRGKLAELNQLLRGGTDTTFETVEGRLPSHVRYVLTLDSDTGLPRESVRRLVGKISHPLNRARLAENGRVTRGYGILQPRVTPSLPVSEESSFFQRLFSTPPGLDPYAFAVSDVYQDLFGEGSFAGKGIYEIDVVETTMAGRVRQNSVLSHDLLEGNLARSGLVTDVEVVEQFPMSYEVSAARAHRWARGDWQLLPYLTHRRDGLSPLGMWKMADNLRRVLSTPALVAAVIAGIVLLPPRAAAVYTALLAATLFIPQVMPVLHRSTHWKRRVTARSQLRGLAGDLGRGVVQGALTLTFAAHHAWSMADATVRALVRMTITRRHLLEWTTAASVAERSATRTTRYLRLMAGGIVLGLLTLVAGALAGGASLLVAAPLAALWIGAPFIARLVSTPYDQAEITATDLDLATLRAVARRTWHYFETFVTAEEHHLPPDNFQEDPAPVVAGRTSPTNIGLYLLSIISAHDFGWIGLGEAVHRLEATLGTVEQLEHHRGHLYNWYDTRTLEPLTPRYISTVDNGNFAGHLITLANACDGWLEDPMAHAHPATGLLDVVALLFAAVRRTEGRDKAERAGLLDDLRALERGLQQVEDRHTAELPVLAERAWELAERAGDLAPEDAETTRWVAAVRHTVGTVRNPHPGDEVEWNRLKARITRIAQRARNEALAMDFAFLYNERRSLLAIGYQVEEARLDENCYDLLASEARLASFIAIAKGDVRTRHWFRLGRSVAAVGGGAALISWSGSMFEYLMPPLIMRAPSDGLLSRTALLVVRRQIAYGDGLGVPWGVSESAYNTRDIESTYQYSQFGVPDLGIVRGLSDNVVVAPYATGLASMVAPDAAAANFRRLADLGARGDYGFYEAVDFTRSRLPSGESRAIVRCYMAHHQGMTIVAVHNAVHQGVMRERFHAEPIVRAAELLLQERAPRDVPVTTARRDEIETSRRVRTFTPPVDRQFTGDALSRRTAHALSNGSLSLILTPAGAGQLRRGQVAITRWEPDLTACPSGDPIYLQDVVNGETWSAEPTPMVRPEDKCEARFSDDRSVFTRAHRTLTSELEHHISSESDTLVRRLTIRNRGRQARTIDVVSYTELALARPEDDRAHPAFAKLFVHTEYVPELGALLATRRRRSPDEAEVWVAHMFTTERGAEDEELQFETDRARFLGRMRTTRNPAWLDADADRAGRDGYVLDPVLSLTQRVKIGPRGFARVLLWTLVADSREELLELIDQHRASDAFDRIAMLSWTQSQVQMQHLGISADEASNFQQLAGHVLFPHPALRPAEAERIRDAGPQSALWPVGISGDRPLVVVRVDDPEDVDTVRELVQAVEYWSLKQFAVDLVILNDRTSSYVENLQNDIEMLVSAMRPPLAEEPASAHVYVLRTDQVAQATIRALNAAARVVIVCRHGDLAAHLRQAAVEDEGAVVPLQSSESRVAPSTPPVRPAGDGLILFNGHGGFTPDGREYVTTIDPGRPTPAPWTNVVANPNFGFHATAEGAGYTWWRNSRDNQLTPWRNDPVSTPPSEVIFLQCDQEATLCSPTALPFGHGRHVARHGFGYTQYEHEHPELGLRTTLLQFVPREDAVKLSRLQLTNVGSEPLTLRVTWYAEPVLGFHRATTAHHLISDYDQSAGALLLRNPWTTQFDDQVLFADMGGRQESFSGDRHAFLGPQGSVENPAAIATGTPLSGRVGAGLDPAMALQRVVTIAPGATEEVVIALGAADGAEQARRLVARYREADLQAVCDEVVSDWRRRLGQVQVRTDDASFDVMMNGWFLYQTLACRMTARSGYYQASGAFGFRDQLQDSMAVVLVEPDTARAHLLRAAGRQFLEGDVQHWWLPAAGNGVRTRISDDVVWLAQAAARYVRVTGDAGVLDERVPYLEGQRLADGEHDAFFMPMTSSEHGTVYEHCVRALEHAFTMGSHGLPLIGTGDWNDGMNHVGAEGRGESVWLGWFLHRTITDFLPLAEARGDDAFAARCREVQERLLAALESAGWDGKWYRRAYFDDGRPLGTAAAAECRIDAIAQSWAVLSGAAQPERARAALAAADTELILEKEGVARLFTPPLDRNRPSAGYIQAYPPGVRENGGQYTHGVQWSIWAHAMLGNEDRAGRLFSQINPVNHSLTAEAAETYRVEPYVVAADVYSVAPHVGRGGWTWYTGASAWLFRAGLEALLGVRPEGDSIVIEPCFPAGWRHAEVTVATPGGHTHVVFEAPPETPRRVASIEVDGRRLAAGETVSAPAGGADQQVRVVLERVPADDSPEGAR